MKKLIYIIVLLTSYPVLAACPIDGNTNACIAESQTLFQNTPQTLSPKLFSPNSAIKFKDTPESAKNEQEILPEKNLQSFGVNNQDYGYNSSCQFGVCMDTGTPQNFPGQQN